jgi:hypothetical protein
MRRTNQFVLILALFLLSSAAIFDDYKIQTGIVSFDATNNNPLKYKQSSNVPVKYNITKEKL